MEKNELKKAIEAVLFVMGDAVEIKRIARAFEVSETEIRAAVSEMVTEMDDSSRGLTITEIDGAYQMCTKKEVYEYLLKIVAVPKESRLTDVQLETLSIIAYKQPVTKMEIEKIRGVNADYAVNRLVELGLVEEKGKLNAPGRPYLFGTSEEFLRRFGLKNLDGLPDIDSESAENLRMEAEEEIGYAPEAFEEADGGTEK